MFLCPFDVKHEVKLPKFCSFFQPSPVPHLFLQSWINLVFTKDILREFRKGKLPTHPPRKKNKKKLKPSKYRWFVDVFVADGFFQLKFNVKVWNYASNLPGTFMNKQINTFGNTTSHVHLRKVSLTGRSQQNYDWTCQNGSTTDEILHHLQHQSAILHKLPTFTSHC